MTYDCSECGRELEVDFVCPVCSRESVIERLRAELRAYKRALPGWVYSPKGDCLYDMDQLDRWDEL